MIYESLVVPHENPISILEIKRALIAYDKVFLVDPADRDIIPRHAYLAALGMPFMGMDMGPVRPMGKSIGYDERFERVLDACKPAVDQGSLCVKSTYEPAPAGQMTIGMAPLGGYPLNIQFVFQLYRRMSADHAFLSAGVAADLAQLADALSVSDQLALAGCGDGGINDVPGLPVLCFDQLPKEVHERLTQISRSRIGALIKYCGYCEAKNIVPILPSVAYGKLTNRLFDNVAATLAELSPGDIPYNRSRVLELCHNEFMLDEVLNELSIEQVLSLRTKAWGRQAEAREALFSSVSQIAQEASSGQNFERSAKALVEHYRRESSDLVNERRNLRFSIQCDVGSATLGGGVFAAGMLSQVESPFASIGVTLALGGAWALEKTKEYVPQLRQIMEAEAQAKRGAGFGLHSFYTGVAKDG